MCNEKHVFNIFKRLSLKQIKQTFLEGESSTLIQRKHGAVKLSLVKETKSA